MQGVLGVLARANLSRQRALSEWAAGAVAAAASSVKIP